MSCTDETPANEPTAQSVDTDDAWAFVQVLPVPTDAEGLLCELAEAINELHVAANQCELDHRTHGPRPQKSRATWANYFRFAMVADDVRTLLYLARVAVQREPTPEYQRLLMTYERRVIALLERFDGSFPEPAHHH